MRFHLGRPISYVRSGLRPNRAQLVRLSVCDGLGASFATEKNLTSDGNGTLTIDSSQFRDLIGLAANDTNDCFLVPEFENFTIELEVASTTDKIHVTSGVEETVVKEEWRDDVIANLFYPISERPKGLVLHMNGAAPILQDARSICLANRGYMVLELGYNLPQYRQPSIYERPSIPLEYIRTAAERLLAHKNASRFDRMAIIGHSKGGDLATAAAIEFTDIFDLAIVNSCMLFGPVLASTTYGDTIYQNTGCTRELLSDAYQDENGFLRLETGMCQSTMTHLGRFFPKNANGEFNLNYDVCRDRKLNGWDLTRANKMHFFHTINDPVVAPNAQLAEEYINLVVEGTEHEFTLLESGHLCSIPYIPTCHHSFMSFGKYRFILDWSRNITPERKQVEAAEYERFFNAVVNLLEEHYQ